MQRPLGSIESAFHMVGEFAPIGVAAVLRLGNPPPLEGLRAALDAVQRHHPMLRARVVGNRAPRLATIDAPPPIPLDVRARANDDDWLREVGRILNTGLDNRHGPLMACAYYHDTDGESGDLILTFDHVGVDARSAATLAAALVATWAGEGGPVGPVQAALPPAADDLMPPRLRGRTRIGPMARFMRAQAVDEVGYQTRWRGEPMPIHPRARCMPVSRSLDPAATAALVREARRRRLTMGSVVATALLRAAAADLEIDAPRPLRAISFADLRAHMDPPQPLDVVGCYVTMMRTTVETNPDDDLWTLAQRYQDAVRAATARDEHLMSAALAKRLMQGILATKRVRIATSAVSYAGPLPVPERIGPVEILDVHGFISNNRLGPYATAFSAIVHDRLTWDFVLLDSDMDEPAAARLADATVDLLTQGVSA